MWYIISYRLQRDNTRNIAVVHTYTRKKRTILKDHKEGQKNEKKETQRKKIIDRKEGENEIRIIMRSGRRPCPEGTTLLFVGTISPMVCPGSPPTENRHDRNSPKAGEEKGRGQRHGGTKTKNPPVFLCPAGGQ